MKTTVSHSRPVRGQTALEYLLLLAVVAVVVIASFGPGSLISQVHDSAQGYYNTVTRVIMGENPKPINGGWCPITCPSAGSFGFNTMYGACECPAPAFGGTPCLAAGAAIPSPTDCGAGKTCKGYEIACGVSPGGGTPTVFPCGPCPTGQTCVSNGSGGSTCACGNGLNCPTIIKGSIPDSTCGSCICQLGTTINQTGTQCVADCQEGFTDINNSGQLNANKTCVKITCSTNMYFDTNPADATYNQCACIAGSTPNGASCVSDCPEGYTDLDKNGNVVPGKTCTQITCPTNMYFDTNPADATYNQCACIAGSTPNGTSCVSDCAEGYSDLDENGNVVPGKICTKITCPTNMYFDTNPADATYNKCACIAGTNYDASKKYCTYPPFITFASVVCVGATPCGPDSNGVCSAADACGTCGGSVKTVTCTAGTASTCGQATPGTDSCGNTCSIPAVACPTSCTPVDATYGPWGACSAVCGTGTQTRTQLTAAQCGGATQPTSQTCTATAPVAGSCQEEGACVANSSSFNGPGCAGTETCISLTAPQCGGSPWTPLPCCLDSGGASCPVGSAHHC